MVHEFVMEKPQAWLSRKSEGSRLQSLWTDIGLSRSYKNSLVNTAHLKDYVTCVMYKLRGIFLYQLLRQGNK